MSQLTEKNWSRWKSHSPFISLDLGAKAARWCPCKKKKKKSEAQQYTDCNALRLLKAYCAFIAIMSFSFFFFFPPPAQADFKT